jgi:hypothetical protein
MTALQAGSSDLFFFYDTIPASDMIAAEVFAVCLQPPGLLFYNRRFGAEVGENNPNTFSQQVNVRTAIMTSLSLRNTRVTDGRGGFPDRRAVTSWNAIEITQAGENADIQVGYIELGDLTQLKKATVPGVGR